MLPDSSLPPMTAASSWPRATLPIFCGSAHSESWKLWRVSIRLACVKIRLESSGLSRPERFCGLRQQDDLYLLRCPAALFCIVLARLHATGLVGFGYTIKT